MLRTLETDVIATLARPIVRGILDELAPDFGRKWSPGLAMAAFAPPLKGRLQEEVRNQLVGALRVIHA